MDQHHRRSDPYSGNFRLVGSFQFSRVVRNVGRRPAHVEPDQPVVVGGEAGPDHTHYSSGRP